MYEEFWNLHTTPFDSNGGGSWFYDSIGHEEATARLHFLVERRRTCGVVTGPPGTGKSTLLARFAQKIRRSQKQVSLVDLSGMTGDDFLWQLVDCLHLAPPPDIQPFLLWRRIRDHLHGLARSEQQTVILFDHSDTSEAGCLTALEHLLRIGDETGRWNTVIVAANHLESVTQLTSWTDLRIDLSRLTRQETAFYVFESLKQAGADREAFEPQALDAIYAITGGILRSINRICELSLLAGMADGRLTIDAATVNAAAENLPLHGRSFAATTNGAVA